MISKQKSFSLLELLITVALIGTFLIAGIPKYLRMNERNREKTGTTNLNVIKLAQEAYKIQTGGYYNGNLADLTSINAALGTSVMPNGLTYSCTSSPASY